MSKAHKGYVAVKKREDELAHALSAALDCHTHFHPMKVVETDEDFTIGEGPIVICKQCVDRMYAALERVNRENPRGYPFYPRGKSRTEVIRSKARKKLDKFL